MAIKDEVIRIRVSKEQKDLFKRVAKNSGISMSEFLIGTTERVANKKEEYSKSKKAIELRAERMEKEIQKLKIRMEERERIKEGDKNKGQKKSFYRRTRK